LKNTIRPVTIRQILNSQFEETFSRSSNDKNKYLHLIDGNEFESATFVANVISVEDSSGKKRFWLEDGTGRIAGWTWIPKDDNGEPIEQSEGPVFQRGTYVRVYGKPDKWNHLISFKIDHIRLIDDAHEIYFHIMESIVATLQYTRGPPPKIYESSSARAPVNDTSVSARSPAMQTSVARQTSPIPPSPASSSSSSAASEDDPLPSDDTDDRSTDVLSDESLYLTTSEYASDSDEEELEELRRDFDAPSTPPQHTHHVLCKCPDKPESLRTPRPPNTTAVISPARALRPDPYSELGSLDRNIILCIHAGQNQGGVGIDITTIAQTAMIANPLDASPKTVQ